MGVTTSETMDFLHRPALSRCLIALKKKLR